MAAATASIELVSRGDPGSQSGPVEGNIGIDMSQPFIPQGTFELDSVSWQGISVTLKGHKTKKQKILVDNAGGIIKAGECCALIGPSGCGKTTFLNALARRPLGSSVMDGTIRVNGKVVPDSIFRKISCFVQNDEPFISALTVSETLYFASQLAGPRNLDQKSRKEHVESLIKSFGLANQADTTIGSLFRKSLSDGQKRRVAVARQLVTCPKILFLDEPTSGLDSAASFQVVASLRHLARARNLAIICSIHQPSASTFQLFDKLQIMSAGKVLYFGTVGGMTGYFSGIGVDIPTHVNPAEHLLELVNTDFTDGSDAREGLVRKLESSWVEATESRLVVDAIVAARSSTEAVHLNIYDRPSITRRILALMHRDSRKAMRDPTAYGIRLVFVLSFAILLGTIWLRLDHHQDSIQSQTSEIFFSLCFISLAALIYAPAFIEDFTNFVHDYRNGFYGAIEFSVSNFIIGIPYLFLSSFVFCIICFWMSSPESLHNASAFFNFLLWIFLTSVAAEGLIVFVVAIYPNFMFAIACASFLNSLLLCTEGFFITASQLNAFYKYGFHYWNYLTYAFQGLLFQQFAGATYSCGSHCQCLYNSTLASQCQIAGEAILERYELGSERKLGKNVCIVIAIIAGYRLAAFLVLKLKY